MTHWSQQVNFTRKEEEIIAYLKVIYRHSPSGRRKMPLVCVADGMFSPNRRQTLRFR
jgi:hypothetical protein